MKPFSLNQLILAVYLSALPSSQLLKAAETEVASNSTTSPTKQDFQDFASMRSELLTRIGGASKRILLVTDYLTDAEIVSSLHIAQYRKLQVSVLLGRERATNILSRLNYLKQVNIPVAIRPKNFQSTDSTMLLIDNSLISINVNLDHQVRQKKLTILSLAPETVAPFEAGFMEAANLNNAPDMAPLPQVGRPRQKSHYYKAPQITPPADRTPPAGNTALKSVISSPGETPGMPEAASKPKDVATSAESTEGVFRYKAVRDKPSSGIPTKLPKTTIIQRRERDRAVSSQQDVPASSTDSP
jgi:hypothetical protein